MPRRESQAVKRLRRIPGPWVQISPLQNEYAHQNYVKQVRQFLTNNYGEKSWEGLDCSLHSRTHYMFYSFHDLQSFLSLKFNVEIWTLYGSFQKQLRRKSFVKVRRTPMGTVYAFTAPKKRVDRWFKQNFNRFN